MEIEHSPKILARDEKVTTKYIRNYYRSLKQTVLVFGVV